MVRTQNGGPRGTIKTGDTGATEWTPCPPSYGLSSTTSSTTNQPWRLRERDSQSNKGPIQCLTACLLRSPKCKAFNYGNRTCDLFQNYFCNPSAPGGSLKTAAGFTYYDVMTRGKLLESHGDLPACTTDVSCTGDCTTTSSSPTETSTTESNTTEISTTAKAPTSTSNAPSTTSTPQPARFVVRMASATFMASMRACLKENLVMAMPVSPEDHKELVKLMRQNKIQRLWIGVQRIYRTITFEFYFRVPQGQPNNSGGTQICVELIDVLGYMWNDYDCENPTAYACQHVNAEGRRPPQRQDQASTGT
ncbi:hypothetical protein HPB47_027095 [Ixodes persulcatus]|uniref:Uncharacterized protein n=1 Tax=Ixodes persulcatus TaxID=34615 RepID=A0AC60PYI1_IXOPE|nr:hypothetical protein HPB47_027095 [Ixodes persulcatus]